MTDDEQDNVKMGTVQAYAECQDQVDCLRTKIRGWHGYLSQVYTNIESARDLHDCSDFLSNTVKAMSGDVRKDLNDLLLSLQERRRLEESLRRMNLGSIIQRP